jgi:hypothetical protein
MHFNQADSRFFSSEPPHKQEAIPLLIDKSQA